MPMRRCSGERSGAVPVIEQNPRFGMEEVIAGEEDVVEFCPGSGDGLRRNVREGDAVQRADVSASAELDRAELRGDAAGDGRAGRRERTGNNDAENSAGCRIDGKLAAISGVMRAVGAAAGKADAEV